MRTDDEKLNSVVQEERWRRRAKKLLEQLQRTCKIKKEIGNISGIGPFPEQSRVCARATHVMSTANPNLKVVVSSGVDECSNF
ncbi:hypothetical protein K1719_011936 [Acacia pycnantha]|nr:hypothetical protein K1719_011936 [Acacia pycnantha]